MTSNQTLTISPATKKRPQSPHLLRRPRERRLRKTRRPSLRFSPTAWAKLLFLRDEGTTEVGGFGITPPDDLLFVEDLCLIRQSCTAVSVKFDDGAVADFFDEQVAAGRKPEQFARIWVHTHPGDSAEPSFVDERTYRRVFGRCDWAVMAILARGGQTYARIRFGVGPTGAMRIPVKVDFRPSFGGSATDAWRCEYAASVQPLEFAPLRTGSPSVSSNAPSHDQSFEDFFFDQSTQERSSFAYSEPI